MSECQHDVFRCDPHCCDEIRCVRCNVVLALVTYQEMREELAAYGEQDVEHWIDKLKTWKEKQVMAQGEWSAGPVPLGAVRTIGFEIVIGDPRTGSRVVLNREEANGLREMINEWLLETKEV